MLAQLREGFFLDVPRKLDALEALVLSMKETHAFTEQFDELFRQVHSLKGAGGTYGAHVFTVICHQFEDQLRLVDGRRDRLTPCLLENWLKFVDLLRDLLPDVKEGKDVTARAQDALEALRRPVFVNTLTGVVVANSRSIVTLCCSVLDSLHFNYAVMENGYEALGQILSGKTDVLITSREVAGLNGQALIAAVRLSNLRHSDLSTVLLTSDANLRCGRTTDPDFIVARDTGLMDKLSNILGQISQRRSASNQ
jgi:HPt (histidine-containing phosphotransfer) domain-containing protein